MKLILGIICFNLLAQNLDQQLEEKNRELIRTRSMAQANEVLGRQALRETKKAVDDTHGAVLSTGKELSEQQQKAQIDLAVKAALLDRKVEEAKESSKSESNGILIVQIFTFLTMIVGYIFTWLKEKRNHQWLLDSETRRIKYEAETKGKLKTQDEKLEEISAILNHEREPRQRWAD